MVDKILRAPGSFFPHLAEIQDQIRSLLDNNLAYFRFKKSFFYICFNMEKESTLREVIFTGMRIQHFFPWIRIRLS